MPKDDELTGEVQTHETRLVVWNVPATIECGETFSVQVGIKCSAGCPCDGWSVEVRDHDGKTRGAATTSHEPWPDTGLHYAHVELSAPYEEGLSTWEAGALLNDLDTPHTEGAARFGVRTVRSPEHLLTIVASDVETRTPVEGAKVVVHPYKSFTDAQGVATVKVPAGEYRLFVSGKKYFPFRNECSVNADMTIHADLAIDRELTDADIWS